MEETGKTEKEAALWRLAKCLFEQLEKLDSTGAGDWDDASPIEQDIYYYCIKSVLLEREDVARVLLDGEV